MTQAVVREAHRRRTAQSVATQRFSIGVQESHFRH